MEWYEVYSLVFLILAFSYQPVICTCKNYSEVDKLILTNYNLMKLEHAFFPPNSPPSVVVDVNYHFTADLKKVHDIEVDLDTKEENFLPDELFVVNFRWLASPVNLFMRSQLLEQLSLRTYTVNNTVVDLQIEVPCHLAIDRDSDTDKSQCKNLSLLYHQLNELTTDLKSYILHRKSISQNGMKLGKEKGYSAYIFSNDTASDYCVIDNENLYEKQRLYMNLGGMCLVVAIMIGAPVLLVGVYDNLRKKLEQKNNNPSPSSSPENNKLFFFWSFTFVSTIVNVLILYLDISTIVANINLYPSNPNESGFYDIYIYIIVSATLLVATMIGDFIGVIIAVVKVNPSGENKFPVPALFQFVRKLLTCGKECGPGQRQGDGYEPIPGSEGNCWSKVKRSCCSECLVFLFGSVSLTLFFQLVCFHSMYIILGALSTPIETISITTFYIADFFCFVAFFAIVLKSTNNPEYYKLKDCKSLIANFFKCICPLIAAVFFVAAAILFILYFQNYVIMVQQYSNNGGYLAIIGSILPSALVSFGGYCATRLIGCTKDPAPVEATGNPAAPEEDEENRPTGDPPAQ